MNPSLKEILPVLQTAIGPVILVSGVGMLLLTMTNRFGRVIDRTRALAREAGPGRTAPGAAGQQVRILIRRARLLRLAIGLGCASALTAALLVIALFVAALLQWPAAGLVASLFIACMGLLIASICTFLYDIHVSLQALHLEVAAASLPTS